MKIIIDFYNQKKTLKKFNQNYDYDDDDEHFFLLHKYLVDDGMISYTQKTYQPIGCKGQKKYKFFKEW